MQNAHNIPRSYNLQVWERCWIVITRRRNYRRLIAINLVFVTYYLLPKTPFQWALDWETPFRLQKVWFSSLRKYFYSLSSGHWYAFISRSAMALHLRCPFPFDLTTSITHISERAILCNNKFKSLSSHIISFPLFCTFGPFVQYVSVNTAAKVLPPSLALPGPRPSLNEWVFPKLFRLRKRARGECSRSALRILRLHSRKSWRFHNVSNMKPLSPSKSFRT